MYKLTVKDSVFTIPKENLVLLAMEQAMDRGIMQGNIHDKKSAIEYLKSIGIEVENITEEKCLTRIPKVAQWNNVEHRKLYNQLFYHNIGRELTSEEDEFCKTMYHMEEYACGLDG